MDLATLARFQPKRKRWHGPKLTTQRDSYAPNPSRENPPPRPMDNLINLETRIRGFDEPLEVRLRHGEVVLGRIRKGQFLADAYFSKEKAIELRDKLTALLGPST